MKEWHHQARELPTHEAQRPRISIVVWSTANPYFDVVLMSCSTTLSFMHFVYMAAVVAYCEDGCFMPVSRVGAGYIGVH